MDNCMNSTSLRSRIDCCKWSVEQDGPALACESTLIDVQEERAIDNSAALEMPGASLDDSPVEWIEHALLSGDVELYDACERQHQLREFVPVRYRPFVVTSCCHPDI